MAPLPKMSFMSACYSSVARNVAKALNGASPTPITDIKLHPHSTFNVKNESVSKHDVYLAELLINTSFVLERVMNVNCDIFNCDQVK